jgi:threonine/homoserine efflux transporter RhtA
VSLSVATAVVVAGLALALPLDADVRIASLYGIVLALVFGVLALFMKSQVRAARQLSGSVQLKAVMLAQGLSFALRLIAVLAGTFVCHRNQLSPIAFVVGFFSTYLVQQAIEVRHLLAVTAAQPEVKS